MCFVRTKDIVVVILTILTGDASVRGRVGTTAHCRGARKTHTLGRESECRGRRRIRTRSDGGRDEAGEHESCDRE